MSEAVTVKSLFLKMESYCNECHQKERQLHIEEGRSFV